MSFTKALSASIVAAGAMALSAPALAAPTISCTTTGCTFGNPDPTVGVGPFMDTFTFTIPFARKFTGTINSLSTNFPVDNVNFPSGGVKINGINWAAPTTGLTEVRTIMTVLAAGTHTITVNGNSGAEGAYGGSAVLGGVPEPMTWALFILGFGVVGAGLRRRQTQQTVRASIA